MDFVYQLSSFTEGPAKPAVKGLHATAAFMMHDPGALEIALAKAVGDDPALVAELRAVFLTSAQGHADALGRANGTSEWRRGAMRLHGLAASFGAVELMALADRAMSSTPRDSALLADIIREIEDFTA